MSLMFLVAAYLFRNVLLISESLFSSVLVEGLYIGGWVLLWEAFSLFFFKSHDIRERKRIYLRFIEMPIHFIYKD